MRKAHRHYEMDMTTGPLLGKIVRFSFPLMLTGILQLLYNAADIVVVGRFAGATALAAVGSTGALINLIVNVFMGLSVGASVVVAQYYGAGQHKDVSKTVHTAIAIALISGVLVAILGVVLARPMLTLMSTPEDVIDLSVLYMTIYFLGMPATMLYNFGAAVLRAVGDTRRPLYFLMISGVVNVLLNLVFVVGFHMSVAGVALATVIAQVVALVFIILCLMHANGSIRLDLKRIAIDKDKLIRIAKVGLPAGIQGSIFSISNVLIQSAVNGFGSAVMAGNSAAGNIEGFIYTSMNALHQAALTFTSQNLGARKPKRLGRIMVTCQGVVVVVGLVMGIAVYLLRAPLLGLYSTDASVIEMGAVRLGIIATTYFLCGIMEVFVGGLRGLGYSVAPMIVSILGACVLRIVWIYTVFAADPTIATLYISYPVSWIVTASVHCVCYMVIRRKVVERLGGLEAENAIAR